MLTNSQSNQILLLANLAFGKSYLTRATLNSYDKSENIQIIVSGKNEEVLGFSVVMVLRPEEFSKYLFLNVESSTDQEWQGYRKMTIVNQEYQGKGIGSELIRKGEAFIQTKSKTVFSSIWCNGKEAKMTNLLDKNGYQFIEKRANYWKSDSLEKRYNCAICVAPPCKCAALIYKKNLTLVEQ